MIKYGKLYWFELGLKDISDNLLVKILRKFGINYIPSLKGHKKVLLREDKSAYSRALIKKCRRLGIKTYVIEEGARYSKNPLGHIPLEADYFVCMDENRSFWEDYITNGRLLSHPIIKPPEKCKKVVFLLPLYLGDDIFHPFYYGMNEKVVSVIERFKKDYDAVFKPHPRDSWLIKKLLPKTKIVEGDALEIIDKYEEIYCFEECSIRKDCEVLGKKCFIL